MKTLSIIKPDDFHVHLRDGAILQLAAQHSARHFGRILVMPNLNPPIQTVAEALSYRKKILKAVLTKSQSFYPLMSLYLTKQTQRKTVREVALTEEVIGFKFYPAHTTTQSQFGICDITKVFPVLEEMEKKGVYLMIHGEDTSADIFDRERVFIEKTLSEIVKKFPALKITLEHITTKDAVDYIKEAPSQVRAGVTPHHLLLDRNDLLSGGLNPHHYCMPIVKREIHKEYLLKTILSGNEKFFLGTDSAPHWEKNKLSSCGCAGIYNAPIAIALCAQLFEEHKSLSRLEKFISVFGAKHYGLKPNKETINLVKKKQIVEKHYTLPRKNKLYKSEYLIPFRWGETLSWQVNDFS